MIDITSEYRNLLTLEVSGIGVFLDEDTRSVYILYSRNLLFGITKLLRERDYRNFKLLIIETKEPRELATKVIDDYKSQGYNILNSVVPVRNRIRIVVNKDYQVEVRLTPKRGKYKLLGTFQKMSEAQEFVEKYEEKKLSS